MRITLTTGDAVLETNPPGPPPGAPMSNHTDRSGMTIHGWGAVLFSLPFTVLGFTIAVLTLLDRIQPSGGTPEWVLVTCGVVFASAGLAMMAHGARGVAHRS